MSWLWSNAHHTKGDIPVMTPEQWRALTPEQQAWHLTQMSPPAPRPAAPLRRRSGKGLRVIGGGAAVVLAAALYSASAGGGGGSSTAGAAAAAGPEVVYIATLRSRGLPVTNEDAMISAGRMVCSSLDRGLDPVSFGVGMARESGLSLPDTGFVIGAAAAAFCPRHRATLDELGN